jgi:hypothetical protein
MRRAPGATSRCSWTNGGAGDNCGGRNTVLQDATTTWHKSWFPRVAEANGRRYLDQADDVKDHEPVRTIDMSCLVYRELLLPLGEWARQVARPETTMPRPTICRRVCLTDRGRAAWWLPQPG